jgi:putative ABC transport system permease protein
MKLPQQSPSPPPQWADKLLEWLCPDELLEEVQGDLQELFEERVAEAGQRQARREYILSVLGYLRPYAFKRKTNHYSQLSLFTMFNNYFKIALRNLYRQKAFFLINIFGLAIGLMCFTLILLFVYHELSFDRFHHKPQQVYRVVKDFVNDDGTKIPDATTPPALAPALQKELPEVAYTTRIFPNWGQKYLLEYEDKRFYETNLMRVDSSFFDVFTFEFVQGNKTTAFQQPHSILLTQKAAIKYFGKQDPMGKFIKLPFNKETNYQVTAILKDVPTNAHFTFDFLIPIKFKDIDSNWGWYTFYTYVRLKENADPEKFKAKLQPLFKQYQPEDKSQFYAQALTDIHLTSNLKWELAANGDLSYVRILITIALFVIIIAGINYINLITAQSVKRAKEVGIRKVAGAFKSLLIWQFLNESILTALVAFGIALLGVAAFLPFSKQIFGVELFLFTANNKILWLLLVIATLLVGLLAGLYPAFYLSSFNPIKVLKGSFSNSHKGVWLRQGLVIFQFIISTLLIAGSLIISQQLDFIQNKKLGYDKENIIVVPNISSTSNFGALSNELKKIPNVVNVGGANGILGGQNWTTSVRAKGKQESVLLNFLVVDYGFLPTMGVEFHEGRNFSKNFGTDTSAIVLNEAAVKQLGLQEPLLGQPIVSNQADSTTMNIIGVVKDFHFTSFHDPIKPFGFVLSSQGSDGTMFVKINKDTRQAITMIEQAWKTAIPNRPFEYSFQDEQVNKIHEVEGRFGALFSYLTLLAILIACLGLFGLAAYTVQQRRKEIGIRKVLGASVSNITLTLSSNFLLLIAIAFIIAIPIALYAMNSWLDNFAYRITITWQVFVVAGIIVFFIAILTVSYQAVKAGLANPVKSLRTE